MRHNRKPTMSRMTSPPATITMYQPVLNPPDEEDGVTLMSVA